MNNKSKPNWLKMMECSLNKTRLRKKKKKKFPVQNNQTEKTYLVTINPPLSKTLTKAKTRSNKTRNKSKAWSSLTT